jgi:hypothetical protein
MTPKEKAKELYDNFFDYADSNYGASWFEKNWHGNVLAGERKVRKKSAKQCALIAVDEIIKSNPIFVTSKLEGKDGMHEAYLYWKEVKQELEKL